MKHTKDILNTLWSRENAVADFIPYHIHFDEQTLKSKQGDYLSIFRLQGIAYESLSQEELEILGEQLNLLYRNIASEHISLWTHIIRREQQEYVGGAFEAGFDKNLNTKYQAKMTEKKIMINELYLSIAYRPHLMPQTASWRFWQKPSSQASVQDVQDMRVFQDILLGIKKGLEAYHPVMLKSYTHQGVFYSELLTFLDFLINGSWCKRPVTKHPIAESLARTRPLFGADDFELRGITESVYGGCLGICDYPEHTHAGFLNGLLSAPFSFILTQSFQFLSQTLSTELLERQRNRLHTTQDHAASQIDAMDEALDDLTSHRLVFGEHHFVLTILAPNRLALRHSMAEASALLVESAVMVAREDWALAGAYWSQLPLNHAYRPRPAPITSRNFAGFTGFHNFPKGKKHNNQWGDAVTMFQTIGNGAYYFNFHEASLKGTQHKALGNSLIIGPSGSGKTVLQGFLMSQSRKFCPKQVVFDKDRGLEIYIRASGGSYFPLHYGKPTGFNPFHLPDTPANLLFLQDFLKILCGEPISIVEEQALEQAISAVMRLPFEMRSLHHCLEFLDSSTQEGLYACLAKWSRGRAMGWVFDNPSETLAWEKQQMLGFDVTEFLDHPEIRTPLMMYLFHRIEAMFDGTPIQIFMDEFWKLLQDDAFEQFAQNKQKVIRKQNGIMIYGTQSAKDILQSKIAHALVEQCATFIFLPNPKAQKEEYQTGFHLSDREFELIHSEMPTRHFLLKQGNQSVVAKLDLQGFEQELTIISGTTQMVLLLDQIRHEYGDMPEDWMPIFQKKSQELLCKKSS